MSAIKLKAKGVVSSLIVLLSFVTILSLAIVFSNRSSETSDIVAKGVISDRIFYKYSALQEALLKILKGVAADFGGINVSTQENGFNIVTIDEVLPRVTSSFKTEADKFERFAEQKMNETNLFVDLSVTNFICGALTINPYGMNYTHYPSDCSNQPAQTRIVSDPGNSWNYLNSYELVFRPNGAIANANLVGWNGPGCDKGNLKLNITIIGTDTTFGPVVTTTDPAKMCRYNADNLNCPGGLGFIHVIHNQNSGDNDKGVLDVQVQTNCNVTTRVRINLTDIPGKLEVVFPDNQAIKVKETLYEIEKNSSIRIS